MRTTALLPLAALLGCLAAASEASATQDERPKTDPAWLDRFEPEDRILLDMNLGYAPPAFTDDLTWVNTEPLAWNELRGKVVLLQTFTTATGPGRAVPRHLDQGLADVDDEDLVVLLVHTPQGVDRAEELVGRMKIERPVAIDARGRFLDELGIHKRPANVLIDRQGRVRHAGLNYRFLADAAKELLAETFDPRVTAQPRPAGDEVGENDESFPPYQDAVQLATDRRGQRAPQFWVQRWLTRSPDAANKVVVLDFWATWCGPCRATIPHLNALARNYPADVVVVGISDEDAGDFEAGLAKHDLEMDDFAYALALDPTARMKGFFGVRGIPHTVVLSADWVVRWQGHPGRLTAGVIDDIVEANRALVKRGGRDVTAQPPVDRYRWTADEEQTQQSGEGQGEDEDGNGNG